MSTTGTPGVFSPWPAERPSVSVAKDWFLRNQPNLLSDWAALKDGVAVRSLLQYSPRTPPAALLPSADFTVPGAITPVHVNQRDALIQQVVSENTVRAEQLAAARAEIQNAFWSAISSALVDTAPLLLQRLEAAHLLGGAFRLRRGV